MTDGRAGKSLPRATHPPTQRLAPKCLLSESITKHSEWKELESHPTSSPRFAAYYLRPGLKSLSFLRLSFFICRSGIIKVLTHRLVARNKYRM